MHVHYLSDLHANHHVPFKNNQEKWQSKTKKWMREVLQDTTGELLVLNGDFSEWNCQTIWLLEVAAEQFDRVFFVPGNHDYYLLSKTQRLKYKNSFNRVEEMVQLAEAIPNVICLHQRLYTYKDVTFAGDTLWYEVKDPQALAFYEQHSNDSQFIHTGIPFIPDHKVLHDLSLNWYHTLAEKKVDVFVSHIPSVQPPMSNHPYNACYVTPVPFLVGKHWIAGHQHVKGSFEKAGVSFHMNAYGYPGEQNEPQLAMFEV